jgi:hypothetical protein
MEAVDEALRRGERAKGFEVQFIEVDLVGSGKAAPRSTGLALKWYVIAPERFSGRLRDRPGGVCRHHPRPSLVSVKLDQPVKDALKKLIAEARKPHEAAYVGGPPFFLVISTPLLTFWATSCVFLLATRFRAVNTTWIIPFDINQINQRHVASRCDRVFR